MIVFLCILGAILALVAVLSLSWLRLRIIFDDGGLRVWLQLLFYKYIVWPPKEPKINLRDYKIKRFRKLEKKRAKVAEKKRKKKEKEKVEKPAEREFGELSLTDKISLVSKLVSDIIRRFAHYAHIDVAKLYIKVASDDAAKTAYLYAATSQAVAYLTELLMSVTNFDVNKNAVFAVYPDFTSETPEFAFDITFRVRVIDIPKLGDIGANIISAGKKPDT